MTAPVDQVLVMAKAPVPGRVKTRLVPPFSPAEAAELAAAALADTLGVVRGLGRARRVLVLDRAGAPDFRRPAGFAVVPQRGDGLGARLAAAFGDTACTGVRTLLVGMDTPQLTGRLLRAAFAGLDRADAVLGLATDGGWWGLGLRDPAHAEVLADVPMSRPTTGAETLRALSARGLQVRALPPLTDVDTVADAVAVAGQAPWTRFAATLARLRPGRSADSA